MTSKAKRKLRLAITAKAPWTTKFEGHGIYTFDLRGWKDFQDLIGIKFPDHKNYIWRGQRDAGWSLTSTLFRKLENVRNDQRGDAAKSHLTEFQYAARGRRGINPAELTQNDWWALGQHYGLATPLLDWTTSPFAAAYFAFCHTNAHQPSQRAIYALAYKKLETAAMTLAVTAARKKWGESSSSRFGDYEVFESAFVIQHKEISVVRPLSNENPRLVNQAGLFTKIPLQCSLCEWIAANVPPDTEDRFLVKIEIPDVDREKCLRSLNQMNINHLTLFPDLEGAAQFSNMHLEIPNY